MLSLLQEKLKTIENPMTLQQRILYKLIQWLSPTPEKLSVGSKNAATRHQWIEKALKSLPSGLRLLDAGAGAMPYKKYSTHLQYVAQDFAQYDPKKLDSGLQLTNFDYGKLDIICDITNISEPDLSFDAILCSEVLEHLPDPLAALKEFDRLLKKGGKLILTAPFCSLTHFAPYHYSTGFSTYFYEKHLPKDKWKIINMDANGNYFEYLAQELSRLPSMADKYAGYSFESTDYQAMKAVLAKLQMLSAKDTGSTEVLLFGWQVIAEKL